MIFLSFLVIGLSARKEAKTHSKPVRNLLIKIHSVSKVILFIIFLHGTYWVGIGLLHGNQSLLRDGSLYDHRQEE